MAKLLARASFSFVWRRKPHCESSVGPPSLAAPRVSRVETVRAVLHPLPFLSFFCFFITGRFNRAVSLPEDKIRFLRRKSFVHTPPSLTLELPRKPCSVLSLKRFPRKLDAPASSFLSPSHSFSSYVVNVRLRNKLTLLFFFWKLSSASGRSIRHISCFYLAIEKYFLRHWNRWYFNADRLMDVLEAASVAEFRRN